MVSVPTAYGLGQNYPNPFHPTTTLSFSMPEAEHVILDVFDATGRKIDALIDADRQPGTYRVIFNGENYSPGLYSLI
ncbi:MAG: hypothetical protein KAR19_04010 [Bacteroidales bacterium]|nr:hypothetical protein [Bacteroidales bacterium]